MTYRGHIKNEQVVLDEPAKAPDGTPVTVDVLQPLETTGNSGSSGEKSIWDALLDVAGTAEGLPPDFAAEHDHYIHGTPKRNTAK
ncbi:MAG TPA: hypothetical protein VGG19_00070 [Tepidisphaeraceae bacterium]|jgi:hypothetical protein